MIPPKNDHGVNSIEELRAEHNLMSLPSEEWLMSSALLLGPLKEGQPIKRVQAFFDQVSNDVARASN
jgi:hypothetical protein